MSECHRSYFHRFLWLGNLNHFVMLMAPDISARSKWRAGSYIVSSSVCSVSLPDSSARAAPQNQHTSLYQWTVAWCFLIWTSQKRINAHLDLLARDIWLDLNKTHSFGLLCTLSFGVSLRLIKVRMKVRSHLLCATFLNLVTQDVLNIISNGI